MAVQRFTKAIATMLAAFVLCSCNAEQPPAGSLLPTASALESQPAQAEPGASPQSDPEPDYSNPYMQITYADDAKEQASRLRTEMGKVNVYGVDEDERYLFSERALLEALLDGATPRNVATALESPDNLERIYTKDELNQLIDQRTQLLEQARQGDNKDVNYQYKIDYHEAKLKELQEMLPTAPDALPTLEITDIQAYATGRLFADNMASAWSPHIMIDFSENSLTLTRQSTLTDLPRRYYTGQIRPMEPEIQPNGMQMDYNTAQSKANAIAAFSDGDLKLADVGVCAFNASDNIADEAAATREGYVFSYMPVLDGITMPVKQGMPNGAMNPLDGNRLKNINYDAEALSSASKPKYGFYPEWLTVVIDDDGYAMVEWNKRLAKARLLEQYDILSVDQAVERFEEFIHTARLADAEYPYTAEVTAIRLSYTLVPGDADTVFTYKVVPTWDFMGIEHMRELEPYYAERAGRLPDFQEGSFTADEAYSAAERYAIVSINAVDGSLLYTSNN